MTKNPIPTGRTAPVLSSGVLDCLVKQSVDNQPYEDQSGLHLDECYKGPYATLKEVLSHIYVGEWLADAHTYLETVGQGIKKAYDTPTCPTRDNKTYKWIIAKIRIEEAEAGDHSFLYIECDAALDPAVGGGDLVDDPYQDIWSMSWQAYSVDPYNFLSGMAPEPYPCTPAFETDP